MILASIYWVLFNTSAPPARIDEAIESMLPDQFEILLYKKNSEYKSWRHSGKQFCLENVSPNWFTGIVCDGWDIRHLSELHTYYPMSWTVGQFGDIQISICEHWELLCLPKLKLILYWEKLRRNLHIQNSKFLDMYISKCFPFLFLIEIGTIANVNFQKKDSPHMEVGIHSFAFVNKRQPCVVYSNAPWLTNFGDTHKDRWPPRCGCVSTPTLRDTL